MENKLYKIVQWEKFKYIIEQNFKISFRVVDDFFVNKPIMHKWKELKDVDIYYTLSKLRAFEGKLLVITDVSYRSNLGPFEVVAENIESFINEHYRSFGEPFLDTDIIILNVELKLAWIIHHEGIYSLINFS